jgi:20S proteasome alpha/beta subunit
MTTIAYRNGILAADTQLTDGNLRMLCHKLFKVSQNGCFAIAGNTDDEEVWKRWFLAGADYSECPKLKAFAAIQVDQYGDVYWWHKTTKIPVEQPFMSIGSGEQIARAGLHMGLSAIDAVKLAGELDINTNTIVDYYSARTQKIKEGQ